MGRFVAIRLISKEEFVYFSIGQSRGPRFSAMALSRESLQQYVHASAMIQVILENRHT